MFNDTITRFRNIALVLRHAAHCSRIASRVYALPLLTAIRGAGIAVLRAVLIVPLGRPHRRRLGIAVLAGIGVGGCSAGHTMPFDKAIATLQSGRAALTRNARRRFVALIGRGATLGWRGLRAGAGNTGIDTVTVVAIVVAARAQRLRSPRARVIGIAINAWVGGRTRPVSDTTAIDKAITLFEHRGAALAWSDTGALAVTDIGSGAVGRRRSLQANTRNTGVDAFAIVAVVFASSAVR